MSEKSDPQANPETQQDLGKLAEELKKKYGIWSAPPKAKSTQVASNIQNEVQDKEFLDVEKFATSRSRYIENKYGLKPMEDILTPKTDEEKKKDLEEYIRKTNNIAIMKQVHLQKTEAQLEMESIRRETGPYPVQYKFFEDMPGYRPEVNIGEKWANMLETQVRKDNEINTSLRRGGYIYQAWKKGKIGVDKFFIIFSLVGAFLIPFYIYNRHTKFKEFLRTERGLKPGEEIDVENGKWDLDELASHRKWYEDQSEKIKTHQQLTQKNEIRKLEEQLYGKNAFRGSD